MSDEARAEAESLQRTDARNAAWVDCVQRRGTTTEPDQRSALRAYFSEGFDYAWDSRAQAFEAGAEWQAAQQSETRCSNPECPLERAHSGPCAPKDWSQSETRITDEMVERFRAGWLKAHDEGDMGNRVRRGLVAALEGEGRMTLAGARRAFTEEEVEAAARAICEHLGGNELNYWLADRLARAALDAVSRIRGEA